MSRVGAVLGVVLLIMIAPASRSEENDALLARFERMVKRNLDNPAVVASATLDSLLRSTQNLPLGDKIATWSRWFADRGEVRYVYGRDPGGYVVEGRLCQDFATDCILFMYRVTELARSTTAEEAVQFAFGTRFYGASIEKVVAEDGRVNYDDASHLEYSEDMLQSGIWGQDITAQCGPSLLDAVGSSRVPPDTLRYLPAQQVDYSQLQSGDLVWFVGDENRPGAAEDRLKGTLIHHLGVLSREGEEIELIHAAAKPLSGTYEGTGVVRVPLRTYLEKVDRFKGIVITRLVEF